MGMIVKVKDFSNGEYYVAHGVSECRCSVSKNAYETLWDLTCNGETDEIKNTPWIQLGCILVVKIEYADKKQQIVDFNDLLFPYCFPDTD